MQEAVAAETPLAGPRAEHPTGKGPVASSSGSDGERIEAQHAAEQQQQQEQADEQQEQQQHLAEQLEISVERRVVPLLEFSDDTCPICLEDYTPEDPGAPTVCKHHFHLQCIMQWAQRSRECPLCFKGLQLEDEDMNELLPFGEYISPEQRAAEAASLETWELERLLLRLAAASQREQHRQHRSSRRATTGGSGGSSSRHRRQGSRGEASAPQPIRGSEAAAVAAAEGGSAGGWAIAGEGSGGSAAAGGRPGSAPGPTFHGSWPPPAGLQASSSGGLQDEGHVVSPGSGRSSSLSLKSRLASLRLRTTKELRSLFSPGSSGSGSGVNDRRGGSGSGVNDRRGGSGAAAQH